MGPLARTVHGRQGHQERGAVATIVAVLLGMGVILGFTALSVDVGSIMWERRQLQNGADAAAFALAQSCAENATACTTTNVTTRGLVSGLNDTNNYSDGQGGFEPSHYQESGGLTGVCAHAISWSSLPACDPTTGTLADCPAVPATLDAAVPYVETHTQTRHNGTSILPTWISRAIVGGSPGSTVGACARVAFGAPGGSSSLPLTFSTCEWSWNTSNGTSYYANDPVNTPAVPYGYDGNSATPQPAWPPLAKEIRIVLQDPPNGSGIDPSHCTTFNGHDVPGGFGYLQNSGCAATIDANDWTQVKPGNSLPSCDLTGKLGTVQYVPIFNCVVDEPPTDGTLPGDCNDFDTTTSEAAGGSNTWYHIAGWAKFYLSGYKFGGVGGNTEPSVLPGSTQNCPGPNRCLYGWFLDGELHDRPIEGPLGAPGSNNFGSYTIKSAG